MQAINLKTNYLEKPMGIDLRPVFSWNCCDGISQSAYQIIAKCEDEMIWDSGKVMSNKMTHIPYGGKEVTSRNRVEWSVTLWDEHDEEGEPVSSFFEMGLLQKEDWKAKWISGNYPVKKKERYPVDCFKKCFETKKVKKARLYITACGLYEAVINNKRVGDFVLAPGHTDYRKRIQYQTYDVTDLIHDGENVMTIQLADGWYRGSCGAWGLRNQYGTQTRVLAQLELMDEKGTVSMICSDSSFQWSNDGPVCFADNKDGETVDANKVPSYGGYALEVKCNVVPSASNNVFVKEQEHLSASLIKSKGQTILDFHQNIAGYISFKTNAKQGQKIKLRFGEMIDENGHFTQKNIQCSNKKKTTPLQEINYICKEGVNAYKTRFAIFGFQYVLVEMEGEVDPSCFEAIAVYSDMKTTAEFDSSNELLNKFMQATLWSAKNNSADVPTDCPTRERHGWTGDAQIFFNTAAYLLDYAAFARKYLNDVYDWQKKNGCLPQIAPYGGVDLYMYTLNGSVGWSDVGIFIPWRFYQIYGDEQILVEYYDRMKKFADFMVNRCGRVLHPLMIYAKPTHVHGEARKYIVNIGQSYGEWAEPTDVHQMHWYDIVQPHPEVSTAYTSYVLGIMADIAKLLNHPEDEVRYREISDKCRESYQVLVQTKEYDLDTDRQAQLVRPLYMKLLSDAQTTYAKNRLIQALEHYGWRLGTGFLSTPFILHVLSDIDVEAAYRLLENEQMPGWLFMPKMGATTIWESWEGTEAQGGIASLDHYSKGACLEWVFMKMCGIQIQEENHFRIAPVPGGHFSHASLTYQSVYGRVSSAWKKEGNKTLFTVKIPSNTSAQIILPNGLMKEVTAGTYQLEMEEQV